MNKDQILDCYVRNCVRYLNHSKEANEIFMRKVEDLCEVSEQAADDFRRMVLSMIGSQVDWDMIGSDFVVLTKVIVLPPVLNKAAEELVTKDDTLLETEPIYVCGGGNERP